MLKLIKRLYMATEKHDDVVNDVVALLLIGFVLYVAAPIIIWVILSLSALALVVSAPIIIGCTIFTRVKK